MYFWSIVDRLNDLIFLQERNRKLSSMILYFAQDYSSFDKWWIGNWWSNRPKWYTRANEPKTKMYYICEFKLIPPFMVCELIIARYFLEAVHRLPWEYQKMIWTYEICSTARTVVWIKAFAVFIIIFILICKTSWACQ